ncbi:MAG: hypothetical protein IPI82_15640 [Candidatus Microthrix sp.]|nr:hypothetical protein [Candidatus Microthrix sp.]MBK7323825.1 hypothetical protein [Candidatus Microthrix sp.]
MNASLLGDDPVSRAALSRTLTTHWGLVGFARLIAGLVDRSLVDVTIIVSASGAVSISEPAPFRVGFRLSGRLAWAQRQLPFGVLCSTRSG